MTTLSLILLAVVIVFLSIIFYFVPIGLWIQSVVSLGLGRITIIDLIRMRLRKIPPRLVADGVINSHKAGIETITTDGLETHFLAGGKVSNVVAALIAADKANIGLNFA
ncbi:MAG: flotillin-like FloA family protein, partial [Candidatus Marinimicrobia bacterium]|nr:flotillin-like FloA family protein [Candidatus Neomarinimicrobiota bacterium]